MMAGGAGVDSFGILEVLDWSFSSELFVSGVVLMEAS
jgi:hypothetical protein